MSISSLFPVESNVLVVGCIVNGRGDVMALKKLTQDLIERGGFAPHQIHVCINAKQWKDIFIALEVNVNPLTGPDGKLTANKVSNVAFQIAFPDAGAHLGLKNNEFVPTLCLNEYNYKFHGFVKGEIGFIEEASLGVPNEEQPHVIGCFVDHDLKDWASDPINKTVEGKQASLRLLSAETLERVIGSHKIEDLGEKFLIYFGYASENIHRSNFVLGIEAMNETGKDLCIVIPGSARFEIPARDGTRIVRGDFSHEEIRVLIKASEDEVLCSGDQSFSEVFSADKQWVYELLKHKINLSSAIKEQADYLEVSPQILNWRYATSDDEIFKKAFTRLRNKSISPLNRRLHEADYFPKFGLLIEKISNAFRSIDPLTLHVPSEILSADHWPTGQISLLSTELIVQLELNFDGKVTRADLKESFKDIRFEILFTTVNAFWLRAHREEGV